MKAVLYTLALAISITSCTTVDKMVKRGEYTAAFNFAIKKIKQGRQLKLEEVKALERAFEILDTKAKDEVASISEMTNLEKIQRKIDIFETMSYRHKDIKYLMPISSKDDYQGRFEIINYDQEIINHKNKYCDVVASQAQDMLKNASKTSNKNLALQAHDHTSKINKYNNAYEGLASFRTKAIDIYCDIVFAEAQIMLTNAQKSKNKDLAKQALAHASLINIYNVNYAGLSNFKNTATDGYCDIVYAEVLEMLIQADKTNNKDLAKRAFNHLSLIDKYNAAYPGLSDLRNKAVEIGQSLVAVIVDNHLNGYVGNKVEDYFRNLSISEYDNLWYDFTMEPVKNPDLEVIIALDNIDLGSEYERSSDYCDQKEICVRIEKVKEIRDSVEVTVDKEIFERVSARVIEVWRTRKSALNGSVMVFDTYTKEYIRKIPINTDYGFDAYGCRYEGDRRALSTASECKLDGTLESFPSDQFLVDNLARSFRDVTLQEIRNTKK